MANKQKTFESTNLPALVNKIVKVRFKMLFVVICARNVPILCFIIMKISDL